MSDKPKKRRAGNDSKPKPRKKSAKVRRKQPARKLTKGERTEKKKFILSEMVLSIDPICSHCVQDLYREIERAIKAVKRDDPKAYEESIRQINDCLEGLGNFWNKCMAQTWHDFEVELAEE